MGPQIQAQTNGPVVPVLEVFIDHVKFTVIRKSLRFLLGEKRKRKSNRKRTKLH